MKLNKQWEVKTMRIRRTPIKSLIAIAIVFAIFILPLLIPPAARAAGNSGVWPVELVPDGTTTAAVDGETHIYVINLTTKARYTGNMMGQFSGVTLSGVSPYPPAPSSGVSVFYANSTKNVDAADPYWNGVNWSEITAASTTIRNATQQYKTFDIPADPAAPFVALKFLWSGASPFSYGFRYSTSGNP